MSPVIRQFCKSVQDEEQPATDPKISKGFLLGAADLPAEDQKGQVAVEERVCLRKVMVPQGSVACTSSYCSPPFGRATENERNIDNRCTSVQCSFQYDARRMSRTSSSARMSPVLYSPEFLSKYCTHRNALLPQTLRAGSSGAGAGYALEGLRFISRATGKDDLNQLWENVERRFHKLKAANGTISSSDFAACIGMQETVKFAGELLDALGRRRGYSGVHRMSLEELQDYWLQMTDQRFTSRMQLFFDLCDKDSDGRISEEEVAEVIMLSASSNKLSILQEQAEEYAILIIEELDSERNGYIEVWQLEELFRAPEELFGSGAYQNSGTIFWPPRKKKLLHWATCQTKFFLLDHWQCVWILLLWFAALAGLFTWKFLQYKYRSDFLVMGYCVCTAKGAAETLKLNMALILLPVCRNTITWLRSTVLGSIFPFNESIDFHKIIAGGVAIGVLMHAGSHLICDFPRIIRANHKVFIRTIAVDFGNRQPSSYKDILLTTEVMTGIVMVVLMSICYLLANYWSRRNLVKLPWHFSRLTGFNAFWYSHHLFLAVYALLIVHSLLLFLTHEWRQKTTWMYLVVPMALYIGERMLRAFRARQYKVNTVKATIYPGDVLAIYMTKPIGFKYQSGMYLFLQCPSISSFEWHPFSITSAPDDPFISVHIRTVGDWTQEMRLVFKEALEHLEKKQFSVESKGIEHNTGFPKLCIDGPYGAPAQDYKKYDVILLIGLGIGATPFISIIKDVLNNIKLAELNFDSPKIFSNSISSNADDSLLSSSNWCSSFYLSTPPRKRRKYRGPIHAYFYWVTREQGSFEWFKGVMNEIAEIDQKAVIEMHSYLTSVFEEGDARSALITLVQNLHHAKRGVDIISGTRVRTHFARPKWSKEFTKLAQNHPGSKIGVFYCGLSGLAKELDELCRKYTQKSMAKFDFHTESF